MAEHMNCTDDTNLPDAFTLWSGVGSSTVGLVVIAVSAVLVLVVTGCYVEIATYIARYVQHRDRRVWIYWISALYTVMAWTSFVGLVVPRAAVLSDLVASVYVSLCMYVMFRLVVSYYGREGRQRDFHERLSTHSAAADAGAADTSRLQLRAPPLCCCCFCLPTLAVTKPRLKVMSIAIVQCALVTPAVAYITAVLLLDGTYVNDLNRANSANLYLSVILAASTLTAMYALRMFATASQAALPHRSLRMRMLVLQLVLVISNLQPLLFSLLATYDVFPCTPPLSSQAKGRAYHFFCIIIEMSLLSVATRRFWRVRDSDIKVLELEVALGEECGSGDHKPVMENGGAELRMSTKI